MAGTVAGAEPLVLPFEDLLLPSRCWVCLGWIHRPRPAPAVRVTYAVRRQGWVKIGMTGNLKERLSVLSRSTEGCLTVHPPTMDWKAPLQLLAVIAGDIEHELHDRFASAHAAGEWFTLTDQISDWASRHQGDAP